MMKRFLPIMVASLIVAPACSEAEEAAPVMPTPADSVVAFVNVNVVPMDAERVVAGQTVIVRGDRIVEVGPMAEVDVPASARIVEGNGRYLMPGLAEMHGHVPPPSSPSAFVENVLFLYVANGITTVRGMLGWDGQLELRDRVNRGETLSPTLYLAGPSFNGGSINSPQEAIDKVRQQSAEGWDLLKIHPGLTRAEYDAMAETAREEGMRFGGHVPEDVGLLHAFEMGQETFDHLDGYIAYLHGDEARASDEALTEVVDRTVEAGSWVVPTMALWEVLWGVARLEDVREYPELRYMPRETVEQWIARHRNRLADPELDLEVSRRVIDNRMRLLEAMNEGGAGILMGTDAPQQFSVPGFSLHRELERMAAAGMTPYEIIRTGTVNVGEYFSGQDDFGTISPGQRADLILVAGNPLEDIGVVASPAGVMVRGRWLPREAIDRRLDEIADGYAEGPAS